MKRCIALVLVVLTLLGLTSAQAEVERNGFLDSAFSMIEQGNIFLERYNEITGANIEAKYELGVPYFFGGQKVENLYKVKVGAEPTGFFRVGTSYVGGFDCVGFTRWVYTDNGLPEHDTLSNLILNYGQYGKNHVYSHRKGKEMPPYDQLAENLRVGDLLVGKTKGRHIMIFMGTLADYGFTAEEVPELAPYLNYALVIHCGPNPFYGERFTQYIAEKGLKANTTNGGVCVSIIGVPMKDAPVQLNVQNKDYAGFYIGDYLLTIWDLPACTSFVWYRMVL